MGGLPLLNFPEISMWGRGPWGGWGANPLPSRFEGLWQQTKGFVLGGMPYSEGAPRGFLTPQSAAHCDLRGRDRRARVVGGPSLPAFVS